MPEIHVVFRFVNGKLRKEDTRQVTGNRICPFFEIRRSPTPPSLHLQLILGLKVRHCVIIIIIINITISVVSPTSELVIFHLLIVILKTTVNKFIFVIVYRLMFSLE